MEKILQSAKILFATCPFDALAVGVIDFKRANFDSFELVKRDGTDEVISREGEIFFDLASLTKPLTNSLSYFINPQNFDQNLQLCLNHSAGIPAWGLLPNKGWKEQILSYPIKESTTLYSDFSALRVMLELEKKGIDQKSLCSKHWDQELIYWTDLAPGVPLVQCGFKNGLANFGEVHDPNAWVIRDFCSHAGLFGTIQGVARTLISWNNNFNFIEKVRSHLNPKQRFVFGWDRVEDPNNTLAGKGCSSSTFGHLGFTGTSIWIDAEKSLGHVILSNAVKNYWYEKQDINDIRRALGELIWQAGLS